MRKIVLTTIGTLGDLHPFIAIALALKKRGFAPLLAVAEDQIAKVRAAGLDAVAVLPGFDEIRRRMGLSQDEAVRQIMGDQRQMLEQVLLPALSSCAEALDAAACGAEAIIASIFVLAAPIIAEKREIPLISIVLQPMAMLSPYDPPRTPDFWMMKGPPVGPVGGWWNRLVYSLARRFLDLRYGGQIDAVRSSYALLPTGGRLMLEAGRAASMTLACYSPVFGPLPPDAPENTRIVGFPLFDSEDRPGGDLDPALEAFLAAGLPPIVFTLGTFAVYAAGNFYAEAAALAQRLGRRAVLLTGGTSTIKTKGDVFCGAYAPHSLLFPRASAIVHHGGVGTTGQALRAGKPQLVVPHMGDQNDNAHRITRMGLGLTLPSSRFEAERALPLMTALLSDKRFGEEATRIRTLIIAEDGASQAAAAIEASLSAKSV